MFSSRAGTPTAASLALSSSRVRPTRDGRPVAWPATTCRSARFSMASPGTTAVAAPVLRLAMSSDVVAMNKRPRCWEQGLNIRRVRRKREAHLSQGGRARRRCRRVRGAPSPKRVHPSTPTPLAEGGKLRTLFPRPVEGLGETRQGEAVARGVAAPGGRLHGQVLALGERGDHLALLGRVPDP